MAEDIPVTAECPSRSDPVLKLSICRYNEYLENDSFMSH
jgi:hypothetical protein